MSSFAEKQLKKYGWTEGQGVGKTNQGIIDPIKASFKFNNQGVGYDISEEFTVNWWEHMFNHTAKKIKPTSGQATEPEKPAESSPKSDEANDDTKTKPDVSEKKSYFYSRFQKGSLLVDGQNLKVEKTQKVEPVEDSYDKKGKKLVSDEVLFALCEGRTAHKGARHGIKMNGKLARIEKMERMEQEKLRTDQAQKSSVNEETVEDSEISKKKKKKKKRSSEDDVDEPESSIPPKKSKKKSKKCESD